jgi:competence protein ComEC
MLRILFLLFVCFCSLMSTVNATNIEEVDLNLTKNQVAFTFFDLSNGEATLIQSQWQNVLINTADSSARDELSERLEMYGVSTIDKLILTNTSEECTGNLQWLLDSYDIRTVISIDEILQTFQGDNQLQNVQLKTWDFGKQKEVLPGIKTNVLYARSKAMVIKFTYGDQKILYMGVADENVEKKLMKEQSINTDILKVGGFGSSEGTIPQFLEQVDPQVAILFHKKGLLPSESMIERLHEVWIDVYETHQVGTVSIKMNLDSYEVITIPVEEKGPIS